LALELAATGVIEALQPSVSMIVYRYRDRRQVAAQHERIHRALKADDADAAALRAYMSGLRDQYREARRTRAQRGAPAPKAPRRG
jgi:DNA-binding FadR family transcriptional regulator